MYRITDANGVTHEVEDLDINVYCAEEGAPVRLTAYPAYTGVDGYKETNTNVILFSAETSFSPEDYYDEWYGWDDLVPGEAPGEVVQLVSSILKELDTA